MRKLNTIIILILAVLIISSCGDTAQKKEEKANAVIKDTVEVQNQNVVYTKYNIPLPVDLFEFLTDNDANFNENILNPISNKDKYIKEISKALNLGIYTADLAYCTVFDKNQMTIDYFTVAQKIADDLDIREGFDYSYMERLESNMYDRDSLRAIADESYWKACNYLEANGKNNILPFVIFSGWIESIYLTINTTGELITEDMTVAKISNQRQGLNNLINYLYEVMIESSAFYYNSDIKVLILKLNKLKKIYDKSDKSLSKQQFDEVKAEIQKIRSDIVKG